MATLVVMVAVAVVEGASAPPGVEEVLAGAEHQALQKGGLWLDHVLGLPSCLKSPKGTGEEGR